MLARLLLRTHDGNLDMVIATVDCPVGRTRPRRVVARLRGAHEAAHGFLHGAGQNRGGGGGSYPVLPCPPRPHP